MLVRDIIDKCNTGLAKGLSEQLIKRVNLLIGKPILVRLDEVLIDTSSNAVNGYLQSSAALYLVTATKRRNKQLVINSCLRTSVQQHILYRQFNAGLCGITAAAMPGRSNHESGLAIDIENPDSWRNYLEEQYWKKLGKFDNMHFDFPTGDRTVAKMQLRAFQSLWNENNRGDIISIDGIYGEQTAAAMDMSPVDGW